VFSDIHSNYHALWACYLDAVRSGACGFLLLGDYVSDLAEPIRTLDLVYRIISAHPCAVIRGNRERYMLECRRGERVFSSGSESGSLYFTYKSLRDGDFDFFESLGFSDVVEINGVRLEIAHSAPDNDRKYFDENGGLDGIAPKMSTRYLLTGHSHRQYIATVDGRTVINPGSVGVPKNPDSKADYALLDISGGEVSCTLKKIDYDVRGAIHSQFASGLVDCARYWSIGILYDIITGGKMALTLLHTVSSTGDVFDEELWERVARELGMKDTEEDIIELYERQCALSRTSGCDT